MDAGIYIPNLCYIREADLPSGACRLCFVEIEGYREPITACTEPVKEGMVVSTKSPRVTRLRRTAAQLIIAAHDMSGPCGKHRHCEVQKLAVNLRVRLKLDRFRGMPRATPLPIDDSNPFFVRNMNKCILCGKCVWVCNEQQGMGAIDFTKRGFDTVVNPFGDIPIIESNCDSSGECVAVCPVGALLPKNVQWPKHEVKSVCPYCSVGCGVNLGVTLGKLVGVRGDPASKISKGRLCVNGRFGLSFVHHLDRLTLPLIRREASLAQASWDESLSLIAKRFSKYSGDEIGIIASSKTTNEANYVIQKFARVVLGTNNVDHYSRLCQLSSLTNASRQPQHDEPLSFNELADAPCTFVIGANPKVSHPVAGIHLGRMARKGRLFIIANPHRIDLCNHAAFWMQIRPGSEVALIAGMMKTILDEGLADGSSIKVHRKDFDILEKSLQRFTPDSVAAVTGVSPEVLAKAARAFAASKPASILYGTGITQHADGAEVIHMLNNLALLTGNTGRVLSLGEQNNSQGACDMGLMPGYYPGYQETISSTAKFEKHWQHKLNPTPGIALTEMIQAAHEGKIKALYVIVANPTVTMAHLDYVREALEKLDFLVVQDMFLSRTAQLAHVVLPAACFAENDGTFTNFEGRVQLVRQAVGHLGGSRPDWWILSQIARRMGAAGFDFKDHSEVMAEISDVIPGYAGGFYDALAREEWERPAKDHTLSTVADTKKPRAKFVPVGHISLKTRADEEYPCMLVVEQSLYSASMSMRVEGMDVLRPQEVVEISSADAAAKGISEGEEVRVVARWGEARMKAKVTKDLAAGVVCITIHSPDSPANRLVGVVVDPVTRIPELKACRVRIEKL